MNNSNKKPTGKKKEFKLLYPPRHYLAPEPAGKEMAEMIRASRLAKRREDTAKKDPTPHPLDLPPASLLK